MSQILIAEYDDETCSLRLPKPLEGFANRDKVAVTVDRPQAKKPWSDLENSLKGENAESFGRAIDEAYPIEKVPPWSDLRGLLSGEEGEEFARIIEEAFPTEPVARPK